MPLSESMKLVTHKRRLSRGVGQTPEQNGWRDVEKASELLQRVEEVEAGLTRTTGGALGFLTRLPGCGASSQDCSVGDSGPRWVNL